MKLSTSDFFGSTVFSKVYNLPFSTKSVFKTPVRKSTENIVDFFRVKSPSRKKSDLLVVRKWIKSGYLCSQRVNFLHLHSQKILQLSAIITGKHSIFSGLAVNLYLLVHKWIKNVFDLHSNKNLNLLC